MLKRTVVEDVKGFYGHSTVDGGTWFWGERGKKSYEHEVLLLAPKRPFQASLLWLQDAEAITPAQVTRLNEIYGHRHELTHELAKFIVDVDSEPDFDLLTDAVQILRDLVRFWAGIEKDIGTFDDHGNVNLDEVHSGSLLVLDMCIRAYVEGLNSPEPEASV
jgi:hypothetical protein